MEAIAAGEENGDEFMDEISVAERAAAHDRSDESYLEPDSMTSLKDTMMESDGNASRKMQVTDPRREPSRNILEQLSNVKGLELLDLSLVDVTDSTMIRCIASGCQNLHSH